MTPLDVVALVWFVIVWLGYGWIADHVPGRPIGLNHHMVTLRRVWMARMLQRENRILDSQLIGHSIHSVTFFASTTMLVLAGLLSMFGAVDRIHAVVGEVSFAAPASRSFFELKVLLLIALFIHGFFKLTWSLRQYNYLLALIGSAPLPPVVGAEAAACAHANGAVMSQAVSSFTAGLRAYYFSFAALAWFVQPWLFIASTTLMLAVLINRQIRSPTFKAIATRARQLGDPPDRASQGG